MLQCQCIRANKAKNCDGFFKRFYCISGDDCGLYRVLGEAGCNRPVAYRPVTNSGFWLKYRSGAGHAELAAIIAEKIPFAQFDAVVAQDVVSGGHVELEVWQGIGLQVLKAVVKVELVRTNGK